MWCILQVATAENPGCMRTSEQAKRAGLARASAPSSENLPQPHPVGGFRQAYDHNFNVVEKGFAGDGAAIL